MLDVDGVFGRGFNLWAGSPTHVTHIAQLASASAGHASQAQRIIRGTTSVPVRYKLATSTMGGYIYMRPKSDFIDISGDCARFIFNPLCTRDRE
jgi:hypothetical protein